MKLDYSLGIIGNLKKLYEERNHTNANLDNEVSLQANNKVESEQAITELDIQSIEAEQTITDLDIRLSILEN